MGRVQTGTAYQTSTLSVGSPTGLDIRPYSKAPSAFLTMFGQRDNPIRELKARATRMYSWDEDPRSYEWLAAKIPS